MLRTDLFNSDLGEKDYYKAAGALEEVRLPLTREGFETLLAVASDIYGLPVDDGSRSTLAGYVHHIDNSDNLTTIDRIARMLYKHYSNALTWSIDQEIKAKRFEEARKEAQAGVGSVVPPAEADTNGKQS